MTAARTGVPEVISALIKRGANVNAKENSRGQTALMWAAGEGHAAAVRALVAGGADLRARSKGGWTALLFAAREGQAGAVRTPRVRIGVERRTAAAGRRRTRPRQRRREMWRRWWRRCGGGGRRLRRQADRMRCCSPWQQSLRARGASIDWPT
jgi:hypothetical protein